MRIALLALVLLSSPLSAQRPPDIKLDAGTTLKTAHLTALQKKLERDPGRKGELEPIISGLKKELEAPAPEP